MVTTQTVTILTPDQLTAIGRAFFDAQATGVAWNCDASIDDLAATILERRERLRAAVTCAPDASFQPQADNEQGDPVWSAGQIADHIVTAQYGAVETAIIALITVNGVSAFQQPLPIDEVPAPRILDRTAALAQLDQATADYERLLDAVPRDVDQTVTLEHRYFGTINLNATLVIAAWHEQGHAAQIESIAG